MNQHPIDRITDIIFRQLGGNITDDERGELQNWMDASILNKEAVTDFLDEATLKIGIQDMYHYRQRVWERVQQEVGLTLNHSPSERDLKKVPVRSLFWRRYAAAAAVLLFLAGSYFLFLNKSIKKDDFVKAETGKDVKAPETSRAMITLANGQIVYLDSVANGQLAVQGNVKLVKLSNGQIAYQTETGQIIKELQYNTLSNPRGSKVIDMMLTDGSRVWLNAGSSVTYPIAFVGDERRVSITGEAYFEVTHNSTIPFKVSKGEMEVTVLGTHFNVNAYDDEADIKVTLLEGLVEVKSKNEKLKIKPAQQAQVTNSINVVNADVYEVMAWRNGKFVFGEKADIGTIMRQIARWYDVDVEYSGIFTKHFGGSISREVNVSQVLKVLETTGNVKCKVEGRNVTVMPL